MEPITRGQTKTYILTIKNSDGSLRALATLQTDKIKCTLRLRDTIVLEKRNATMAAQGGSNAQIEPVANGSVKLKFVKVDTVNLDPCFLDGDVWVESADGVDSVPVQRFVLQVMQSQTRAIP